MAYVCARPKPRHFSDGLEQRPSRGHGQVSVHADVSWPVTESDVFQGCGCGRVPMWYRALKGIGRGGTCLTVVPGRGRVIVAVVPGFACANGFCAKAGLRPRIATPVNNAAANSGLRNIIGILPRSQTETDPPPGWPRRRRGGSSAALGRQEHASHVVVGVAFVAIAEAELLGVVLEVVHVPR